MEKVLPRGDLVGRFAGVALVVAGVLLVAPGSQNNQFYAHRRVMVGPAPFDNSVS